MTDWVVNFEDMGESTKLTIGLTFATQEEMQKIINMGFEAGFTESLSNLEHTSHNNNSFYVEENLLTAAVFCLKGTCFLCN